MTPSDVMTAGQIGKFQELLGAGLRKAAFPSEPVQRVLETQGEAIISTCVAAVRRSVEAISDLIVRHVTVDRDRTPKEVLDATNRAQYTDGKVVKAMPKGDGAETDVYFFKLGRFVSDDDLEKEYALRGLDPADPYALAQVNTDDPALADDHPNGTHWKDTDGRWCFATFSRWGGGRRVDVSRDEGVWSDDWWFAGVRK